MIKKILVVLLALTLIVSPALATCPTTWNDPNLTCIVTQNWHDFVNNWTYQNTSIWGNFGNYYTSSTVNSLLASNASSTLATADSHIASNMTVASGWIQSNKSAAITSANSYTDASILSNVSIVSSWIATNNSATLATADSHIASNVSSVLSTVGGWISANNSATLATADSHIASNVSSVLSTVGGWISANNSATLATADSHIASNVSSVLSTVGGWVSANNSATLNTASGWIQSNASSTLITADSHIASNVSKYLPLTGGTMTGHINTGGYNVTGVGAPVAGSDAVNLTYFNVNKGGGLTWATISGTTASASVNYGYIPTNSTRTIITLPSVATIGQSVQVTGYGSGGWNVSQNSGQTIYFTGNVSTTTGTSGWLSSNTAYDSITLRCVVANASWVAESFVGNIEVN